MTRKRGLDQNVSWRPTARQKREGLQLLAYTGNAFIIIIFLFLFCRWTRSSFLVFFHFIFAFLSCFSATRYRCPVRQSNPIHIVPVCVCARDGEPSFPFCWAKEARAHRTRARHRIDTLCVRAARKSLPMESNRLLLPIFDQPKPSKFLSLFFFLFFPPFSLR